ncbi:MAG: hypothetical protein GC160_18135 [Acidobacteria bacterium]|nr:hypothetical protein [Acidobacteriota bacterium]
MASDLRLTRRGLLGGLVAAPALAAVPAAAAAPATGDGELPALWTTLDGAEVRAEGDRLTASTGEVRRSWLWRANGFATTSLRRVGGGQEGPEWAGRPRAAADWSYPGLIDPADPVRLLALTAQPVRFDPLTSDRIEIVARIDLPAAGLELEWVVWVYPGAPGLRTQLRVRRGEGFPNDARAAEADADFLPIRREGVSVRAMGYFNHTQGRNLPDTEILRDEPVEGDVDWACLLHLERNGEGCCLVKESHKCVNQTGVDTGAFRWTPDGLANTGWGPSPSDFLPDRPRDCWAGWVVLDDGSATANELAVKRFDRLRFPVDPRRDIYIMANTWGSGEAKAESLAASAETNILRQIESAADLGIDVQQIDDGWQGDNQYERWSLSEERYPEGWGRVRQAALDAGVDLGLWAAWTIDREALFRTWREAGFRYYKIDFAKLDSYGKLEDLFAKMRELVELSGQTVRVNWDVTENPPRVGYYYARDLGNIYLENRKPMAPERVVYHPWLVLRDAWQVARYTNLNRFQISIQNPERVNRKVSDAWRHPHPYTVALALMGSPIFFQETHYYGEDARRQIRPLLALYKQHREALYRGYVFGIGAKPDNASWTGFQSWDPASRSGYLMIYREIGAAEGSAEIPLRFVGGRRLEITDLRAESVRSATASADGAVRFEIPAAPGFLFLLYTS